MGRVARELGRTLRLDSPQFAPGMGSRYCDQRVYIDVCLSLSACLYFRSQFSKNTRPIFTKFSVHVTCGRGSFLAFQLQLMPHCNTLCSLLFSKRQRITLRLLYAMSRPSVCCL